MSPFKINLVSSDSPIQSSRVQITLNILGYWTLVWHVVSSITVSRPQGFKTFFMLNSIEYVILNAHRYKDIKEIRLF